MMTSNKKVSPTVLKEHQHKVTGPRLAVLDILSKAKEPLTIKEILGKTKKRWGKPSNRLSYCERAWKIGGY